MRLNQLVAVTMLATLTVPATALGASEKVTVRRARYVMGTIFEIRVRHADEALAAAAVEEGFRAIRETDRLLSDYREDSEVTRLNRAAPFQLLEASDEMEQALELCAGLVLATGGSFDPTVRPVTALWRESRETGIAPTIERRQAAMKAVGWSKLGYSGGTIRKRVAGVELDFGAFGKGWALDRALSRLREAGIRDAYLSAGESTILALGSDREQRGWRVLLRDPFDAEGEPAAAVNLFDQALSTSAGYERDITIGSRRYSHIVDPRTGEPTPHIAGSSVVAGTAARADALSTALFVSGQERAAEILRPFRAGALLTLADKRSVLIGEHTSFELPGLGCAKP
jgi:thiamine biosynthesis lipoprotein